MSNLRRMSLIIVTALFCAPAFAEQAQPAPATASEANAPQQTSEPDTSPPAASEPAGAPETTATSSQPATGEAGPDTTAAQPAAGEPEPAAAEVPEATSETPPDAAAPEPPASAEVAVPSTAEVAEGTATASPDTGVSYGDALRQLEEWQAYIAGLHEERLKEAEERRDLIEKHRQEMLDRALERQAKLAKYYEAMKQWAEEQRSYLEEHRDEFLGQALERQEGLAEYHKEMRRLAEERRADIETKLDELDKLSETELEAYLGRLREQMREDALGLGMESPTAPMPDRDMMRGFEPAAGSRPQGNMPPWTGPRGFDPAPGMRGMRPPQAYGMPPRDMGGPPTGQGYGPRGASPAMSGPYGSQPRGTMAPEMMQNTGPGPVWNQEPPRRHAPGGYMEGPGYGGAGPMDMPMQQGTTGMMPPQMPEFGGTGPATWGMPGDNRSQGSAPMGMPQQMPRYEGPGPAPWESPGGGMPQGPGSMGMPPQQPPMMTPQGTAPSASPETAPTESAATPGEGRADLPAGAGHRTWLRPGHPGTGHRGLHPGYVAWQPPMHAWSHPRLTGPVALLPPPVRHLGRVPPVAGHRNLWNPGLPYHAPAMQAFAPHPRMVQASMQVPRHGWTGARPHFAQTGWPSWHPGHARMVRWPGEGGRGRALSSAGAWRQYGYGYRPYRHS